MTREEAVDVLKHNYPSSCYEDLCKAVDMAIKALEQPEPIRINLNEPIKVKLSDCDNGFSDEQPTIESEIIQCKDCVHSRSSVWLYANRPATVDYYCARTELHKWPYESCDKAERREEGDK